MIDISIKSNETTEKHVAEVIAKALYEAALCGVIIRTSTLGDFEIKQPSFLKEIPKE